MELVVALIVAGFLLMFLETYLPGLIAGILGILCLVAGILAAYLRVGETAGHWTLMIVLGLTAIASWAYVSFFPESSMAKRFISYRTVGEIGTERPELLNRLGFAHTTLRPAGTVVIDGQRVDVVAEGSFVEKGSPVRVIVVEGSKVVVRAETESN